MTSKQPSLLIPFQILDSLSHKCWNAEDSVTLQVGATSPASQTPVSVYTFFERIAKRLPEQRALAVKRDGQWKYWSYREYFQQSKTVARALIKLGLDESHGVCIMGANSPEWFMANFGAIFAGGLSVGIYANNSADACLHIARDSRAQVNEYMCGILKTIR